MCKVMEQFFLGFYLLAGTYRGKSGVFFLNFFFFLFLQQHILPQGRQVGKVGGW